MPYCDVVLCPPKTFETARLRLRPPELKDAAEIFAAYAQDPDVTRYLRWRPHHDVAETAAFVRRCEAVWEEGTAFPWLLLLKRDDRPIGMAEMRVAGHMADLGYVLARPYWGAGYVTEAVRSILDWALAQPDLHRVWATCDVDNVASARVLEKLGMTREGVLRRWAHCPNLGDVPRDSLCYSRTKEA